MKSRMTITWVENGYEVEYAGKTYVCERKKGELIKSSRLATLLQEIYEEEKQKSPQ